MWPRGYFRALREMVRDAHKIAKAKKTPKHLRVAAMSHARHLAKVRAELGVEP